MPSNKGILVVLRWQINFDRDQKATAINGTTGSDRLFGLFSYKALDFSYILCLCLMIAYEISKYIACFGQ
jgi:hypothetical protein